jgi:hypothetical protein
MVEEDNINNSTNTDNPNDNSTQPAESEGKSPIEEAKKILEETKQTLSQISEERKRIEKATAEMLINGRSYAGQTEKKETDEEKWKREAKIRYAGTGMDPT